MKKLFIVISDGGDGSYYPCYTFNEEFIKRCNAAYNNDKIEYGFPGIDGDGFHYEILTVPDECTLNSLGIDHDFAETKLLDKFNMEI